MPSMQTRMLWVDGSLARKSSNCGRSTPGLGPMDTTVEKPTPLCCAQSRIDVVSAPDCDTSASGPGVASGPSALALSPRWGRWKPRLRGPSSSMPRRRAVTCSAWHSAGVRPLATIRAA